MRNWFKDSVVDGCNFVVTFDILVKPFVLLVKGHLIHYTFPYLIFVCTTQSWEIQNLSCPHACLASCKILSKYKSVAWDNSILKYSENAIEHTQFP